MAPAAWIAALLIGVELAAMGVVVFGFLQMLADDHDVDFTRGRAAPDAP